MQNPIEPINKYLKTLYFADYKIKLNFSFEKSNNFNRFILPILDKSWQKRGFFYKEKSNIKHDFEINNVTSYKNLYKIIFKKQILYFPMIQFSSKKREAKITDGANIVSINFLLKTVISELTKNKGFIIHASAVIDQSKNLIIFIGKSGEGKTTMAKLLTQSKKYKPFCDDSILILKRKDKWFFYNTPLLENNFDAKVASSTKAKIFFIKKSSKADIKKIDNESLIAKLFIKQAYTEKVDNIFLKNLRGFVSKFNFFSFYTELDAKKIVKLINENK